MYNHNKYKEKWTSAAVTQSIQHTDLYLRCLRRHQQKPKYPTSFIFPISIATITLLLFDVPLLLPVVMTTGNYYTFGSSFSPPSCYTIAEIMLIGAAAHDAHLSENNVNKGRITISDVDLLIQDNEVLYNKDGEENNKNLHSAHNIKRSTPAHPAIDEVVMKSTVLNPRDNEEDKRRKLLYYKQLCEKSGKGNWDAGSCICIKGCQTSPFQDTLDIKNYVYCGHMINPRDIQRALSHPTENMTTSERMLWFFQNQIPALISGNKEAWESPAVWVFIAVCLVIICVLVLIVWWVWKKCCRTVNNTTDNDGDNSSATNNTNINPYNHPYDVGKKSPQPFTTKELEILRIARSGGKYCEMDLSKYYHCPSIEEIQNGLDNMRRGMTNGID